MQLIIGADHAGVALKEVLKAWLIAQGHAVTDVGTRETASVDYPTFAHQVADAVVHGAAERGVLVCGSGIGMAITANRHPGIRAVVIRATDDATFSREHNNANVACFGGRMTEPTQATALLDLWIRTDFAGERHARRVQLIERTRE
jgi:ribose 5-phosphate isomerase B